MDDVRGGWARCCFVCRRAVPPALLAVADGRPVAGVCAVCAREADVLRAAQGALGFFFPGAALTFRQEPPVAVAPDRPGVPEAGAPGMSAA